MFFDNAYNYILNATNNQVTVIQPNHFMGELPITEGEMFQPLNAVDWELVSGVVEEIMGVSPRSKYSCLISTLKICSTLAEKLSAETKVFLCSSDVGVS